MRTILFATTLSVLLTAGCASSGARPGGSRGSADMITQAQLDQERPNNPTLFDIVQRLHPNWLYSRSATDLTSGQRQLPMVVVDGSAYGDVSTLKQLHVNDAREIHHLDSRDATTKYGTGYAGGAIEITSP